MKEELLDIAKNKPAYFPVLKRVLVWTPWEIGFNFEKV
jgi:hypothetical protein